MEIQCQCGEFKAILTHFPQNSPGRLMCYCDDCQKYLKKIGREDLLDSYGGTQVIPVYPNEFKIISGKNKLKCNLLSPKGLNRWSTTCCNSPVGNTRAKFPWVGIFHNMFTVKDAQFLDKNLGGIRSRIQGRYAKKGHPFPIPNKLGIKDVGVVLPFLLKGFIFKKYNDSPFLKEDGVTPLVEPILLP